MPRMVGMMLLPGSKKVFKPGWLVMNPSGNARRPGHPTSSLGGLGLLQRLLEIPSDIGCRPITNCCIVLELKGPNAIGLRLSPFSDPLLWTYLVSLSATK